MKKFRFNIITNFYDFFTVYGFLLCYSYNLNIFGKLR